MRRSIVFFVALFIMLYTLGIAYLSMSCVLTFQQVHESNNGGYTVTLFGEDYLYE